MANAAASWATMPDTDMAVTDYTVTVTDGVTPATFTFRVRRQPLSNKTIATLSTTYERYGLTFIVEDVTDHEATGSPMLVYGVNFTNMLIRALRSLIVGGTSMIPKPGTLVSFGSAGYMIVDTAEFAQHSEGTNDVFLVTCNIKEQGSGSAYLASEESPKLARSDEVPPWEMPADISFSSQTVEGQTNGFAYAVGDLDGKKTYDDAELRTLGKARGKLVPVENYAHDPFSSPPSFPKVSSELKITKAFLRGGGTVDLSSIHGTVNSEAIALNVQGAVLVFPMGTLSPTSMAIVPKVYKMTLPWFNKTKHPLGKTYGELFYGYSGRTANQIAINKTGQTILVTKPLTYLEISASFSFRPEGFAVWLANRGYTALDSSVDGGRKDLSINGKTKECWLSREGTRSDDERIWRGFTMMKESASVVKLLQEFFPQLSGFDWATQKDNFGQNII